MNKRTWIIVGANSIIAKEFAHLAAKNAHDLLLIGRNEEQLLQTAQDLRLRYACSCEILLLDLALQTQPLLDLLTSGTQEYDLFLAHSDQTENEALTPAKIQTLVQTNITSTALMIQAYLQRKQKAYHLLFLSSMAACRGRAKNSLYGASKAAIEVYLQGLQQAHPEYGITIARLGFIDTRHTYGKPGVFLPGDPKACAKACWKAVQKGQSVFYFPKFWKMIGLVLASLPRVIYHLPFMRKA